MHGSSSGHDERWATRTDCTVLHAPPIYLTVVYSDMGWLVRGVLGAVVAWVGWQVWQCYQEPPMPHLDPEPWWGLGDPQSADTTITPFTINIPNKDVEDLRARLSLPLRPSPPLLDANFTYGLNSDTLQQIVDHWRNKYEWRKREARLNTYTHYKTQVEGLDIHFLRARAQAGRSGARVVPLLLIHGWPGSFVEFYDILPLLTQPHEGSNVVFEVICPSIPGYGFSQAPAKKGFGHLETSQVFLKLMQRLGYDQFYVQGGDWGSLIATAMATLYPKHVLGVHINMINIQTPGATAKLLLGSLLPTGLVVDQDESSRLYPLGNFFSLLMKESGYAHIQATKPDTIGGALNQSPVSLAAYILEKFSFWTHKDNLHLPDGGLLQQDFPIKLDKMLDNICIYWFSGSITSSVRYYAENINKKVMGHHNVNNNPCVVPAGLAAFPQEIFNPPKSAVGHKFYDIVSYTELPAGGHFAAMERPQLLAADLHQFVTTVEKRDKRN